MSFTYPPNPADVQPPPTSTGPSTSSFPAPRNGRVAAVAVTVGLVGVAMFILIVWLVLRLRRRPIIPSAESGPPTPMKQVSTGNDRSRSPPTPKAPREPQKLGIVHKPLRTAHQRDDGSWDFSDQNPTKSSGSPAADKSYLSPLTLQPSPSPRSSHSSLCKDEPNARTPTSTDGFDLDVPPPAYLQEGGSGYLCQYKES
ncbi:hypothetical protein BV22DRAFT_1029403 [Leucogyrophana mollusca]|uniref:Uncharacterized protein n=1 Tax=Leucogyrophana mollusca TaxID=85980 RepID=A0ACB8BV88_9AGAM|nr:hypothetical protein BV22DRAFT_1029403 [Leucogyrophana mollusca]